MTKVKNKKNSEVRPPIDWDNDEEVKKLKAKQRADKHYRWWIENESRKSIDKLPNELRQYL